MYFVCVSYIHYVHVHNMDAFRFLILFRFLIVLYHKTIGNERGEISTSICLDSDHIELGKDFQLQECSIPPYNLRVRLALQLIVIVGLIIIISSSLFRKFHRICKYI